MPPRFMERMARQAQTLDRVFGDPESNPPPYPQSRTSRASSHASSQASSMYYKTLPVPPPHYSQLHPEKQSLHQAALPKESLVLVTGANSWQGIHIVDQLLERGYRVRGTVRDAEKAIWTGKFFGDKYGAGRFMTAVIPDMAAQGAFNIAVRGCSGVVHVASVTSMSSNPDQVVTPSIAGTLNALEAAALEPMVIRFVHCSAISAAIQHDRGKRLEVTSQSWNMLDFNDAWAPPPYKEDRALAVSASSKMQAEASLWRWYEVRQPQFTLNTVLPDTLWGKVLVPQSQDLPLSVTILKAVYDGTPPEFPPCYFVDVQDSALLHVAALLLPDVRNERLFAVSTPWNVRSLTQLVKGLYPQRNINGNVSETGVDQTNFKEAGKAEELLRRMGKKGWTDLESSVERTLESLI